MGKKNGRRVAIVAGLRTPFVKMGSAYKDLSALDLGEQVVTELLQRSGVAVSPIFTASKRSRTRRYFEM